MIGVRAACLAACLGMFPGGSRAEEASKPKTTLRWRHQGLRALTFSPNGKLLATSGACKVVVWDLTTGKAKATFKGVRDGESDLLSSARTAGGSPMKGDGGLPVGTSSVGKDVRLGSVDGTLKHTIKDLFDLGDMAFSPDEKSLAWVEHKAGRNGSRSK